ncbi:hypothetical protein LOTGIDRAFT_114181 [Lottia gigantea]|uniref:GH10 domain-containing protein n=1 Tax=Lottia gigantea TaxID=225164 RepID=V4CA96_LOTGI|nr:hypothetical protein LOTGIDRAFT_114181 [Lottia gigantea]ESO98724.1 hypothetical protein LOTGIDRAFT_114181 [Lottia gigantea]
MLPLFINRCQIALTALSFPPIYLLLLLLLYYVAFQIQQLKSEFGWGSAVNVNNIHDSAHHAYQKFFYDTFEWAVLENALKWPALEGSKVGTSYITLFNSINLSCRIKVRGHNIFWGGGNKIPRWQKSMSGAELKSVLEKHIQDMTKTFKGKFQHWDVENENIHLHYYEDILHDPDITQWMFRETHRLDPHTKCYLNDYSVVSSRLSTLAYLDQALKFKAAGVPVGGMGIQSHLGKNPDLTIIKKRLDEVAKAGYPIWITELDINESDENKKSKNYEDVMRLYFSHPAVHGVMFWGFWDGRHWRPSAALANGDHVTPNAAGRKVQNLLQKAWRTNETRDIQHGQKLHIRAFKGNYKLLVHHNGNMIHSQNFSLNSNGNSLNINLSGSGEYTQIFVAL